MQDLVDRTSVHGLVEALASIDLSPGRLHRSDALGTFEILSNVLNMTIEIIDVEWKDVDWIKITIHARSKVALPLFGPVGSPVRAAKNVYMVLRIADEHRGRERIQAFFGPKKAEQ